MAPALTQTTGLLIAFEGLDQSGKQTQAESLRDHLRDQGREAQLLSFPDYSTAIGDEIAKALHGGRDYPPDVLQLLTSPIGARSARRSTPGSRRRRRHLRSLHRVEHCLWRRAWARRRLAHRNPAVPAGASPDDPPRHRAGKRLSAGKRRRAIGSSAIWHCSAACAPAIAVRRPRRVGEARRGARES